MYRYDIVPTNAPSIQYRTKRNASASASASVNAKKNVNIVDPFYITGFVEADGSFYSTNGKTEYPRFVITQDVESLQIITDIKNYFGPNYGYIVFNKRDNTVNLTFKSMEASYIIAQHFEKYPLQGNK